MPRGGEGDLLLPTINGPPGPLLAPGRFFVTGPLTQAMQFALFDIATIPVTVTSFQTQVMLNFISEGHIVLIESV